MTTNEARKMAWDWIMQDGDDEVVLVKIAKWMDERGVKVKYAGGRLFIGGEEVGE